MMSFARTNPEPIARTGIVSTNEEDTSAPHKTRPTRPGPIMPLRLLRKPICVLPHERPTPALYGRLRILRSFEAAIFEMMNNDGWVVDDAKAKLSNSHAEISIFVVARRIVAIKTTERLHQRRWHEKEDRRTIIHVPRVARTRVERVAVPGTTGRASVAPDHATGFLQPAMRANDLSPDCTDTALRAELPQASLHRARREPNIIV